MGQKCSKLSILAQIWPFFAILGVKKIFDQNFLVVIEVVWRPNFMQKIRKKGWTVKAVGPELTYVRTYVRTYGRTHESEFIGSFRSLKTSGEPIKMLSEVQ